MGKTWISASLDVPMHFYLGYLIHPNAQRADTSCLLFEKNGPKRGQWRSKAHFTRFSPRGMVRQGSKHGLSKLVVGNFVAFRCYHGVPQYMAALAKSFHSTHGALLHTGRLIANHPQVDV